jgi:hypothetical protein
MSTSKMDSDHSVTDLVIDTDLDDDMDASITQPSDIQSSKKRARESLGDTPILAASLTTDPAITIKPPKKKKKNKGRLDRLKTPLSTFHLLSFHCLQLLQALVAGFLSLT